MKLTGLVLFSIIVLCFTVQAYCDDTPEPEKQNIKYKAAKDVDFESLLIQGQLKRPEMSVVTGNTESGADGLLRLRENFIDRVTEDFGEEAP